MRKNKDKSAYDYVKEPLIYGDPSKKTIEQIIELVKNKYRESRLAEVNENPETFYELVIESLNKLFYGRDHDFRKNLTYSLVKMIFEDYSKNELNTGTQLFLAAIIHISFDNLKENEEDFREIFCEFDADKGDIHAFCRYIIINEIEKYCCCEINSVRPWHNDVINADGEIFKKYPLEDDSQVQITSLLWDLKKKKNKDSNIECLKEFLMIGSHSGITSAYRMYRKDLN